MLRKCSKLSQSALGRGRSEPISASSVETRLVGLPASRALIAFGRGDYAPATQALGLLPEVAHRIGGSHAQRDLLYLTLLEAAQRLRRSKRSAAA